MIEPSPELLPRKLRPWGMVLWILAVHPLGVGLSRLLFWIDLSRTGTSFSLEGPSYLLATAIAGIPLGLFAVFALALRPVAASRPSLRFALKAGMVAFLVTSLVAQVIACKGAVADAQGGLLFLFLPLYAAVLSAVFMVLVYGLARLRGP
ncbi:hypothetical protein [Myxococcus landrumensis]|uniref:Lipoprotein n=1 Tax=Myxococcus landrumensis TaxID=2813577 RepID=A0ABX7MZ75_9BACT|nr:hypothetical protein [Myxococcus landrumus]QSQ11586.1 hypothetical protein JY572_24695 [Myxococcus landrumus]